MADEQEVPDGPPPWRHETTEGLPDASKVSPQRRVAIGVLAFLAVGVVTYVTMLWLRPLPRPILFAWTAAAYPQLPFGSVPFSAQDQAGLAEADWFAVKALNLSVVGAATPQDTIVVTLSGRAACDEAGRVLLLEDDAVPGSIASSHRLQSILAALKSSQAKHVFLLVDIFQPLDDPYIGALAHDLPKRVADELAGVPDDRRLTLLSCRSGQTPLVSPELGRSVFGHYVDEALRGWSDSEDAPTDQRGQVTARRLARYVEARVDRWAPQNRQARQTPQLIGSSGDFPLVALPKGRPQDRRELTAAVPYPTWLTAGFAMRDQWHGQNRVRPAAWLVRQLDTVLLEAERDWAGGADAAKTSARLKLDLDRIEKTWTPFAAAPAPEPTSLAQLGAPADAALVKTLLDLIKKIDDAQRTFLKADDAEKAIAKLTEAVLPAVAKSPEIELHASIFAAAVQDPFPRRGTIQLFNRLLAERDPDRLYEETLTVRRLADLAVTLRDDQWPVRTVHKVLELTRRGTFANSKALAAEWLPRELDAAAQKRHDAEVLFYSRGYTPLVDAEKAIDDALAAYELLLGREDVLARSRKIMDDALAELPWLVRVTEPDDPVWLRAVKSVQELEAILVPDDPAARTKPPVEEIGQRGQELKKLMAEMNRPFTPAAVAAAIEAAKAVGADASQYVALERLMRVPWTGPRADLWAASRDLGGRLAKKTAERDVEDGLKPPSSPNKIGDDALALRQEGGRVPARVRRDLALLTLVGTRTNQIELLQTKAGELLPDEPGDPPGRIHGLAAAIDQTWTEFLPTQWKDETKPGRREGMARVWPGWLRPAGQTMPLTQATAAPVRQSQVELWGFLGDLYRFESRDPDAPAFFAKAAFIDRDFTPPAKPHVVLPVKATPLDITPAKPKLTAEIPVQFVGGPFAGAIGASIIQPDDEWLVATLDRSQIEPPAPGTPAIVPLGVTALLRPGAELSSVTRPLGFLVRLTQGNRSTYHRVTLPFLPNPERVELVLSTNPQQPTTPFADLRLRPTKGKQSFYVFVRNGTDKARNIVADLRVNKELVPGGTVTLAVPARQTVRLPFPGPPPAKVKEDELTSLPLLEGPIDLRIADKDTNEVLAERTVNVTQASPREYVRVPSIRFEPAADGKKNRLELTVRAGNTLAGPPCVVELELPPRRIPGLKAVRDGVFRGEMTAPGQEIKLYASDIDFEPGADEEGVAYLNVDGIPRAIVFRVTYARFGEPTTPREDDRPSMRIVSERYFRTGSKFQGRIEVDNPPGNSKLLVALGKYTAGEFEAQLKQGPLPPRQKGIGFGIRPSDGALEFEPFTRDWVVAFDSVPVRGERVVHARLVNEKDQDIVPFVDQVVIFDDQVPERVAFIELPKRAQAGVPLLVAATGQDRGAGIKDVVFFVGAVGADKKLPPVKVAGEMMKEDIWAAKLQMPSAKGPTEVGVEFTNRVGLKAYAKGVIEIVDYDPVKNQPGSIQGTVVEGEAVQGGLVVTLSDAKGNKIAEQKTKAGGEFYFERLAPGVYVLRTEKPAAGRRRTAVSNVTLQPGQNARIKLELTL